MFISRPRRGRPSTVTFSCHKSPTMGAWFTALADSRREWRAGVDGFAIECSAAVRISMAEPATAVEIAGTWRGSNPGEMLRRLRKLEISSPAPTSSTSATAISPATSSAANAKPRAIARAAARGQFQPVVQVRRGGA